MSTFFQYVVEGLTIGAFYALVALGYTMVYGIIRLINFAHGDVFMVGAFIGWTVIVTLLGMHWALAAALFAALAAALAGSGALGVLVDRIAYQPLLAAPRLSILITALGVSLALENGVLLLYGPGFSTYPHALTQAGLEFHGVQ